MGIFPRDRGEIKHARIHQLVILMHMSSRKSRKSPLRHAIILIGSWRYHYNGIMKLYNSPHMQQNNSSLPVLIGGFFGSS